MSEAILEEAQPQALHGAVQKVLDRLASELGTALRLVIETEVWEAGQGMMTGAAVVTQGPARLEGVTMALPAGVMRGVQGLLRAVTAHDRAARRRSADLQTAERATSRLARRDDLLRRLFDLSPVGVVLIDYETGHILEANLAFMGFGHWSREALIGTPIRSILNAKHEEVVDRAVAELKAGGSFGPIDQPFLRPDGSEFPAIVRGLLLTGGDGQRLVWMLAEDVSEIRAHLAEMQAVRDEALCARAELHTAVQALPHGFMLYDAEDRLVLINSQISEIYPLLADLLVPGRKYEDVLREGIALGQWPVEAGQEEALLRAVMERRKEPALDQQVLLADGRIVRVVDRQIPTGGRVGLRIDITAERDNEQRLTQVIEGSQAGTWEIDFLTWENRVNERWASMLGWTCQELAPITLTTWSSMLHPDDVESSVAKVVHVARGQADRFDMVFRLRHRAGHWVWVQSRGIVSKRSAEGHPLRMSGVHVDVSALKEAEQRLAEIIEGAEAGIWYHDMVAGLCHVNELWVGMLGYTLEELGPVTDAVWQGLLHPDDWIMLNRNMQERFAAGIRQFQDELRLRHKEGHWVWVASRGQTVAWDAQGNPVATSGVHLDISARKRLEGDLKAERDFLAKLTETSGSGILAVDEAARIVFFNREVQTIFEQPADRLMNQVCDPEALGLSDAEGNPLSFSGLPCRLAINSDQAVRDMRMRVDLPDGRTKDLSVNAAVLADPSMTARVVCTITDITATAQAERDLRTAIGRAEAANRAKSQFLANMSHELRTPLNGVLGMAELLDETPLDPSQRGMLGAIRESGAHLLSVVNDLLDLAKIESGKLVLDVAPLNLRDLAARIEAMHGLTARRKEVEFHITLGAGAERARLGDAKRVLQIVHNLVGNAVKFTESGSVAVSIAQDARNPVRIVLQVSDTGIGMTDDQTARVFEEFTQGDESITRRFGGTGLGLPIVRRLVALMDGEISLVSTHGRGTTVTVTLPMPPATVPEDKSEGGPALVLGRAAFAGLRALLAEDNPTNRLIMRAMLARLGISVTLVCDGDEAVEIWTPGRFDLVLLDISMPRKDGLTALAELRVKAGAGGLPPVLAVTANAMAQHLEDYRAAGFADVVTKPVTLEALAGAIARTRPVAEAEAKAPPAP
ncbi:PAS domain S-box protein [Pseudotabrizicola algicola]|uniref:PAS domain S-box protein n=1 Tax=Pseudotabrizicola algicola TaxID=2709381 RepID=UPI00196869B3|nr:PAS domain S-box protein [Pseudotabrizicola algicola]